MRSGFGNSPRQRESRLFRNREDLKPKTHWEPDLRRRGGGGQYKMKLQTGFRGSRIGQRETTWVYVCFLGKLPKDFRALSHTQVLCSPQMPPELSELAHPMSCLTQCLTRLMSICETTPKRQAGMWWPPTNQGQVIKIPTSEQNPKCR